MSPSFHTRAQSYPSLLAKTFDHAASACTAHPTWTLEDVCFELHRLEESCAAWLRGVRGGGHTKTNRRLWPYEYQKLLTTFPCFFGYIVADDGMRPPPLLQDVLLSRRVFCSKAPRASRCASTAVLAGHVFGHVEDGLLRRWCTWF